MKRINKILFTFLLVFIYINSLSAGTGACGVTLHETDEAKPSGFKTNMSGCYEYTPVKPPNPEFKILGPRPTWSSAKAISEEMKTITYAADDGKSYKTGSVPLCEGLGAGRASIEVKAQCQYHLTKETLYDLQGTHRYKEGAVHKSKLPEYETIDATKDSATNCDSVDPMLCGTPQFQSLGCVLVKGQPGKGKDKCTGGLKCARGYSLIGTSCYKCPSGYYRDEKNGRKCNSIAKWCPSGYYPSDVDSAGNPIMCFSNKLYCNEDKKNMGWYVDGSFCYSPITCDHLNYSFKGDNKKYENRGDANGKNYKITGTGENARCKWIHCPYDTSGKSIGVTNLETAGWKLEKDSKNNQVCRLMRYPEGKAKVESLAQSDLYKRELIEGECDRLALYDRYVTYSRGGARDTTTDDPCTCEISYIYKCPLYECNTEVRTIDVCTPRFQTNDGKTAYCLNPNDPFSPSYSKTANYQLDSTFNVRNCSSSYSTVDCGYANILIEGKKLGISDTAVELALRLWGAHADQKGFHQYGISLRYGSSCGSRFYPRKWNTSEIKNVYKQTYKYLMENVFKNIKDYESLNVLSEANKGTFKIACDTPGSNRQPDSLSPTNHEVEMIGIACGNNSEYQQAAALFFNTLLGNKAMQSHLTDLYGGKVEVTPESAYFKTDAKGSYIEVHFEETQFNEVFKNYSRGEVIDCYKLDKNDPNYNKIASFCQVQVELVNSSGNNILVKDTGEDGTHTGNHMDECVAKSSSCRRRIKNQAICDVENITERATKIKVITEKSASSYAIRKYVACANPESSQILFAYGDDPGKENKVTDLNRIETKEVTEFNITNYICKGNCNNYNVRDNMKKECAKTGTEYGKVFHSSVKDPSLNCILNMNSASGKEMYDYSDYFKVNKNVCRIYCSDEVEYYIADKVKTTSGRTFKYDIEPKVNATPKSSYPLSSMIKERRTCVSEIYYNNLIPDTNGLQKAYGFSAGEVSSIGRFNDLFDALVRKAESEGGRVENINQIIYDLYNCNFYAESVFTSNNVVKPKESKTGNLWKNINAQYSESNNYGLVASGGCTLDISRGINTCIKEKDIVYSWGTGPDGNRVKMASTQAATKIDKSITYCTGKDCFKYNKDDDAGSYVYPKSTDTPVAGRWVKNQTTTKSLNVGSSYPKTNNKLRQWFKKDSIMIPTNDYVIFEVVTDVDFYNASEFQSLPQDDGVINKGSRAGNYINLDKYVYPVSKNAYNDCERVNNDISRCTINQEFETIATFYRKNVVDAFTDIIKNNMKFTCYVDVVAPVPPICEGNNCPTVTTRYRNVDTADMFPRYSELPANWNNKTGESVKLQVESTSDQLKTTDNLLEYSIVLTPTQIKNLNRYNKNAPAYSKEKVVGCEIKDDYYVNCKSELLNAIRADSVGGNGSYGTLDSAHNDGVSNFNKYSNKSKY